MFAHVFVPFTTSANLPQTLVMPPLDYVRALGELLTLDFTGEHVRRAVVQLGHWLSGPQDWLATVPLMRSGSRRCCASACSVRASIPGCG